MNDTEINVETANRQLSRVFAPWVQSLALSVEAIGDGEVRMRLPHAEQLCRQGDSICGQALMTGIDTCMVFVCYLAQGRYGNCTTVSQHTSFMRPAIGSDLILAGRVVKPGRQLVFGEVDVYPENDPGRIVCAGQCTYMLLPD